MDAEKRRRILRGVGKHIGLLAAFSAPVIALGVITGCACPFRLLTGIPCPFCGMTRAHLAALRLDFPAAFRAHPLFPLGLPFLFLLFHPSLFGEIYKKCRPRFLKGICVLFIVTYLLRGAMEWIDF